MTDIEELKSKLARMNQKPLVVATAKVEKFEEISSGLVQSGWTVIPDILKKFKKKLEPLVNELIAANKFVDSTITESVFIFKGDYSCQALYVIGINNDCDITDIQNQLGCFIQMTTDQGVIIKPDEKGNVVISVSQFFHTSSLIDKENYSADISVVFSKYIREFVEWLGKAKQRSLLGLQLESANLSFEFGDEMAVIDYGKPPKPTDHSVIGRIKGLTDKNLTVEVIGQAKKGLVLEQQECFNKSEMADAYVHRTFLVISYQTRKKSHFLKGESFFVRAIPASESEIASCIENTETAKEKQQQLFTDKNSEK